MTMFDILSKFSDIKEKMSTLLHKSKEQQFKGSDSSESVVVITNGKKDITSIRFNPNFDSLSKDQKQQAILDATQDALNQSEVFIISELKSIMPAVPGLNIFG